jgi:hypothetical protein
MSVSFGSREYSTPPKVHRDDSEGVEC